ncbi:MAG: hypothetical protein LKJ69_01615 [Lactobacillus sp.]|jgi:hypothetical protein|nr:hypothetical protein [Lactobacillus sp.]MCI2032081.1 hypothetical protein [Lactobacillus sp.]
MAMKINIGGYSLRMTAYRQISVGKPYTDKRGYEVFQGVRFFNDMERAIKYLETCLTLEKDISTAEELLGAHKHAMFVIDSWLKGEELPVPEVRDE